VNTPKCLLPPVLCMLAACTSPSASRLPGPTQSEYFTTLDGRFVSEGKMFKYVLTVKLSKPLNHGHPWYAVVEYENPANPSAHLTYTEEVFADQGQIVFTSPAIATLRNHKTYSALVKVYSDRELNQLITTHPVKVRLDMLDPAGSMLMRGPDSKQADPFHIFG
jgi:hypothetical protein